jgi:hypothetical protein
MDIRGFILRFIKFDGRLSRPAVAFLLVCLVAAGWIVSSARAQTGGISITSGPNVAESSITETGAVINWVTNVAGSSVVDFGTSSALGETFRAIEPMTDYEPLVLAHSMSLMELKPDTTYYFQVTSVAENGSDVVVSAQKTFKTKASSIQPVIEPAQATAPASLPAPTTIEPVPTIQPAPTTPAPTIPAPAVKPLPVVGTAETASEPDPPLGLVQTSQPTEPSEPADALRKPTPTMTGVTEGATPSGEQPVVQPAEVLPVPAPTPTLADRMMGSLNDFQAGLTGGGGAVATQLGIVAAGVTEPAGICEQNGIKPERCAAWLETRYADRTCAENGRLTKEACEKFLTDRNNGVFPGCEGKTAEECDSIKAMTTIGYLPSEAKQAVDATISGLAASGGSVDLPGYSAIGPDQAADAVWWPSAPAAGAETSPAVVVIDGDHDGLPDDIERSLGTDPDRADTDGDGVSDAEELKRGTDPLGEGAMERKVAPAETAIIEGLPLEQPLGVGQIDEGYDVVLGASAGNAQPTGFDVNQIIIPDMTPDPNAPVPPEPEPEKDKKVSLTGHCAPDTTCLLYIYSYVPLVLATVTDTDGNWSYDLSGGSLADGQHMVYVANIDAAGKIVKKSNPLSLFIKEAQAVTVGDFMRADLNVPTEPAARFQKYYIIGVILLIAAAGVAFLMLQRRLGRAKNGGAE